MIELGGDGPFGRPGIPLDILGCVPFDEPDIGGVMMFPRLWGGKPGDCGLAEALL